MNKLNHLSATQARKQLAARTITSEQLVRDCLEHIATREPAVGAWMHLAKDAALSRARELDQAPSQGLLHGIPIGVKDLIDTVDMPTSYGTPIYANHQPAWDAPCVAMARAAGAVVLGKTVTTELAYFTPGKTANPRNVAHTPGGSSSGSASAVADNMVPLAFGSQTAGSVIRPAAFCGVVGYKPSFGLISRVGAKALSDTLDTIGVLARIGGKDMAMTKHSQRHQHDTQHPSHDLHFGTLDFGLFLIDRTVLLIRATNAENSTHPAASAAIAPASVRAVPWCAPPHPQSTHGLVTRFADNRCSVQ
ncbi:MAG: amidase [Betaproteobacteria bacterium]|nr:amidase [Betaproteobacteria bacterium]